MKLGDDGMYHWTPDLVQKYDALVAEHNKLVKNWNRFIGDYKAVVEPKDIGRPLLASGAQCSQVRGECHNRP